LSCAWLMTEPGCSLEEDGGSMRVSGAGEKWRVGQRGLLLQQHD
jgi:hypothetical protein